MKTKTTLQLIIALQLFCFKLSAQIKIPYPVIFIHGLESNSETWNYSTNFMDSAYNFNFAGRIDYCLNLDGDNTRSNLNFYPVANADIGLYTDPNTLSIGDYYYINFDVGMDGSFPVNSVYEVGSNQSAIMKQGAALSSAIAIVLQKTGRDKVVLMAHSMGGLCARAYLENTQLWQQDGQHHVAKLITAGTPHAGSNQVTGGSVLSDIHCASEAYRDLRTSYSNSGASGVFLFGGAESVSVMDLSFCSYFDNIDVNCNGIIGENIVGLNSLPLPSNIDYTCMWGECTGCTGFQIPGDGIVLSYSADLTNIYPSLPVNKFVYSEWALMEIHRDLPSQKFELMEGLDEPNEYNIAYEIEQNITYTAFTSTQPIGGYFYDYDDYSFNLISDGILTANINNIQLLDLMARIVDINGIVVGSVVNSNGNQNMIVSENLTAGTYYLEIYGEPTASSFLHPHTFSIHSSSVGIEDEIISNDFYIFPNPTNGNFSIATPKYCSIESFSIINMLGEIVFNKKETGNQFTVSTKLDDGIYYLKINSDRGMTSKTFIVVNEK